MDSIYQLENNTSYTSLPDYCRRVQSEMASSGILPPITFEEEKRIDDLESRFYSQSYAFRIDRTLYIFPCPDHTSEEPNVAHNVEEGVEEKEKFHHFSSIPNEALQYLEKSSQILLFSGETGSGYRLSSLFTLSFPFHRKTLLCQKILSYFCEKSSSSPHIDNTLEEKITMIAPILELFSHAQTFQSLNSSRIAKLFKFRFKVSVLISINSLRPFLPPFLILT